LRKVNLLFWPLFLSFTINAQTVSLKDNVLFGFEKCKSLSVDLEKGQLIEASSNSFDLHCRKISQESQDLKCSFFDAGSDKKINEIVFSGGSHLGAAELKDNNGRVIKFLIGKKFASYESPSERKVCVGIFIFEQDALKQRASSPKSGL
jgi:hypothetical protein